MNRKMIFVAIGIAAIAAASYYIYKQEKAKKEEIKREQIRREKVKREKENDISETTEPKRFRVEEKPNLKVIVKTEKDRVPYSRFSKNGDILDKSENEEVANAVESDILKPDKNGYVRMPISPIEFAHGDDHYEKSTLIFYEGDETLPPRKRH